MTKEEVLQKVNDYCNEKSYTNATLTDGFKDKFAEHFAKRYPDAGVDDETAMSDMKFALNSAFSGASLIITEKTNAFTSKENEYKSQIAELQSKIDGKTPPPPPAEIPKEVQDKLDELEKFKVAESKKTKFAAIMDIAKKGIRQDLHASFDTFAKDYDVMLDKEDKEQADKLVQRFGDVMKSSIGDIKPLTPHQIEQNEDEFFKSLKKVTVE